MYSPRPPAPTAAAIVAEPTATTAAMRTPETMLGMASGHLDLPQQLARRHAQGHARIADGSIDTGDAGDRRPQDRQQGVERQRHDRRARPDAAEQRQRQQEAEHRQARHGLHGVGQSDQRRAEPRTMCRGDSERYADRRGHQRRESGQEHVLPDQREDLRAMLEPEADHVHHVRTAAAAVWRRARRQSRGHRRRRTRRRRRTPAAGHRR